MHDWYLEIEVLQTSSVDQHCICIVAGSRQNFGIEDPGLVLATP